MAESSDNFRQIFRPGRISHGAVLEWPGAGIYRGQTGRVILPYQRRIIVIFFLFGFEMEPPK
jgi:hypothetical protein